MEKYKVKVLSENEIKEIEEIVKKVLELKNGCKVLVDISLLERIINDVIKKQADYNNTLIKYIVVKGSSINEEDIYVDDGKYFEDGFFIEEFELDDKLCKKLDRKNRKINTK